MDQQCPQGSRSANSTVAKASTQGQSIKEPWEEESKVWALELSTSHSSNPESSAKARREKKDRCRQEKRDRQDRQGQKGPTNVRAQKIDGSILETFGMVLASFQMEDKLKRAQFFQETFLLADLSIKMVLWMSFLTFSNANVQFARKELT